MNQRSMHPRLIGSSSEALNLQKQIAMVASLDCTVLILGETGTGKEVVARSLHEASTRSMQQFVEVNCAAIPSSLLESELFGHERGAFTGAVSQTSGRFHLADRGTLFLDEVGDMPLELQPKFLRVLEDQRVQRVGGSRATQVNVRLIAATNQDLGEMVHEKNFRADLFYRLNIFPIRLKPLRERREDIPELAEHFVNTFNVAYGRQVKVISKQTMECLLQYGWPGNIRELRNFIERSVIQSQSDELNAPIDSLAEQTRVTGKPRTLAEAEREHVLNTLNSTNWIIGGARGAAALLGIPRTTLYTTMQRLGISRQRHLSSPSASNMVFKVPAYAHAE